MAITGINHVVLKVRNLERSEAFYRLLGFSPAGHRNGMRFLRAGTHHHDLALFEVGERAPAAAKEAVGLFHFCVTVEREGELAEFAALLEQDGHKVSPGMDHVVSRSFYTKDPDGNTVELTWDAPESEWRHMANPFAEDRAYTLPHHARHGHAESE